MKLLIFVLALIGNSLGVQFNIINYHGGPINVGIQGNSGKAHLAGGGFTLNQGASRFVDAPNDWAGRFWARTWCVNGNHCETGDCGNIIECNGNGGAPPATLVEINLRAHAGQDFYDISLVDGFNSKALIRPVNGNGQCPTLQCKSDLNSNCPNELRLNYNGQTIGCKSACLLRNEPQYCCTGEFGPDRCNPNNWPENINSAKYFKANCPQAYSYAYDDRSSLFTCVADTYEVEFG
nr:thaumatin-like protein 1b [Onthophagus taurus]